MMKKKVKTATAVTEGPSYSKIVNGSEIGSKTGANASTEQESLQSLQLHFS